MAYCMNRDELAALLGLPGGDAATVIPGGRLAMAAEWIEPLAFLTYSLACLLERNRDAGPEAWERTMEKVSALPEQMYVTMQECDADFTTYMMHHLRKPGVSLEEDLVDLERQRLEFRYDKTLRY